MTSERAERRPLENARVVVTGAAGFIGSHLVDALLARGVQSLVALDDLSLGNRDNLDEALDDSRVAFSQVDCSDPVAVAAALGDETYDACFNLAVIPLPRSLTEPKPTIDINVMASTTICELARAGRFRTLLQYSSSEVYGSVLEGAIDEDRPPSAETPYAASKVATDSIAVSYQRSFGIDMVIVRPFNNYGPRQNAGSYAGLIPTVFTNLERGEAIVVDGDGAQSRDFVYVGDTVGGTLLAYESLRGDGAAVNLGSGRERTVLEVIRGILGAVGRPDWPIEHGPPRPGDVRRHLADITRAREVLGFEAVTPFEDGLRATAEWYGAAPKPS